MFMLLLLLCGTSFCSSLSSSTKCSIIHDIEENGVHVDCQGRGLTEIPKHFPVNTTSINLSYNQINSVKNYSFIGVPKLRSLDLSSNVISNIEPQAFWNCQSLKSLNIKANTICVNDSVFHHLDNLQELAIDDCYNAEVLKPLTGLTTIEIVANQECNFEGFNYLISLRNIVISGIFYCHNDTFKKLYNSNIISLTINAILPRMERNALAPLIHLHTLIFSNTRTGLSKPFNSLYALVGRNLTTLVIEKGINIDGSTNLKAVEERTLTKERLKYLSQICVSNFSAPNNNILFFDVEFIENSPIAKCLKHIDLRRNMISNFAIQALFQLWKLTKLEYVDFSDQALLSDKKSTVKSKVIYPKGTSLGGTNVGGMIITLPEHLKTIIVGRASNNMGECNVDLSIRKGRALQTVDFSFNGLSSIKHFYGIPNANYIDLSGNKGLVLPNDVFCSIKMVKVLKMSDMSFQQNVIDVQANMFLNCLPQLRTLDISGNRLVELPSDLFKSNPLLEYLDLSRNIFISIPVHLNLLPNLHLLDMSSNSIGSLDKVITDDIDNHYLNSKTFQVHLIGNFFECSCSNLQFLSWLSETEVITGENSEISCITEDGNIIKTKGITNNMLKFWRKCKGVGTFFVSFIFGTIFLCCIFVALLIDTNRTKFAFFLINALKYQVPKRRRKDFKRDVYLSYADADYQWACHELRAILEERNLNLFIWDRDSVPGDCTAEVITETVNQCWKVVLYFTENYERDAWSYLTTMAAVNSVDNLNPERLILLFPENENPRVPECLLQVVPESCIFYVPRDIRRDDAFWDELERYIKRET